MFNENDHPRDGDGKFTEKNGAVTESSKKVKSVEAAIKDFEGLSAEQTKQKILSEQNSNSGVNLSKQEWAMFYERLGKIKKEGHYVPKTSNGEMIISLETDGSNVIVIAKGTYQYPIVRVALRFENNEYMYRMIEKLEEL